MIYFDSLHKMFIIELAFDFISFLNRAINIINVLLTSFSVSIFTFSPYMKKYEVYEESIVDKTLKCYVVSGNIR